MSRLWDPGLQPERTALAHVRTALATATAALVVARVGGSDAVEALAGLGLVVSGLAVVVASRRHAGTTTALTAGTPVADGRLPLATSLAVSLVGLAAALSVFT